MSLFNNFIAHIIKCEAHPSLRFLCNQWTKLAGLNDHLNNHYGRYLLNQDNNSLPLQVTFLFGTISSLIIDPSLPHMIWGWRNYAYITIRLITAEYRIYPSRNHCDCNLFQLLTMVDGSAPSPACTGRVMGRSQGYSWWRWIPIELHTWIPIELHERVAMCFEVCFDAVFTDNHSALLEIEFRLHNVVRLTDATRSFINATNSRQLTYYRPYNSCTRQIKHFYL